jgi:hypothetical protein
MPRLPDGVEPPHPVQAYDLRVGVIRDQGAAQPVGHVLVESVVRWRRLGGVLWWRRWGEPEQTALASVVLHGTSQEWFIEDRDELETAVDDWGHGRWVAKGGDGGRKVYAVSWLSAGDSVDVARQQLGMDVDEIRRRRRP